MSDREHQESLATYNLLHAVHAQALKLLGSIAQAGTMTGCRRAADRAEGFTLGLETIIPLNTHSIEALYVTFEQAAILRGLELELELAL